MSLSIIDQPMTGPPGFTRTQKYAFRDRANYASDSSAYIAWNLRPVDFSMIMTVHLLAMDSRRRANPKLEAFQLLEDRIDGGGDGWQQKRLSWKLGTAFKQLPVSIRVTVVGSNVTPNARFSLRLRRGRFNLSEAGPG